MVDEEEKKGQIDGDERTAAKDSDHFITAAKDSDHFITCCFGFEIR